MRKGKSRTHIARTDIMQLNDESHRRQQKRKARGYDQRQYDKPMGEER